MTEAHHEMLSAAMDGALSRDELRFLLRRLDHDAALLDAWSRYQVGSDGLRRQLPGLATSGFATRVMLAIDAEQGGAAQVRPQRGNWVRLSVGGAIAASVAVAALMVSQPTARDSARPAATVASSTPVRAASNTVSESSANAANLATVPSWLSTYPTYDLSQRASVSLGDPSQNPLFAQGSLQSAYPQHYSLNGTKHTTPNSDGSYLLLIDTPQTAPAVQSPARRVSPVGR